MNKSIQTVKQCKLNMNITFYILYYIYCALNGNDNLKERKKERKHYNL